MILYIYTFKQVYIPIYVFNVNKYLILLFNLNYLIFKFIIYFILILNSIYSINSFESPLTAVPLADSDDDISL